MILWFLAAIESFLCLLQLVASWARGAANQQKSQKSVGWWPSAPYGQGQGTAAGGSGEEATKKIRCIAAVIDCDCDESEEKALLLRAVVRLIGW